MSCSILAMKQDKINMLLNVKRIMFVNMFYFLLFYLEIKTESVPVTKPRGPVSLCTHGTSLELTGLLHTPPAGNIFFCVVIIGDKTE